MTQLDRADRRAMNVYRWLGAVLVVFILALADCAQEATEQGQPPVPSYPHDNGPDMRSGMM